MNSKNYKTNIHKTDYYIGSADKKLFVCKIYSDSNASDACLLFVHGNTFPSIADFDLPVNGHSFADYMVRRGVNCCIFDHRGYGKSYKPGYGEPIGLAEKAGDLAAVYDFLILNQGIRSIWLICISSGCNTIAEFLSMPRDHIVSMIFLGPCYLFNPHLRECLRKYSLLRFFRSLLGRRRDIYFSFSRKALEKRLYRGEENFISREAFDKFVNTSINTTSPGSKRLKSPILLFPNPDLSIDLWQPLFDARRVMYPLLIIRGDRDNFCCRRSAETLVRDVSTTNVRIATFTDKKHDMHLYTNHLDIFVEIYNFIISSSKAL